MRTLLKTLIAFALLGLVSYGLGRAYNKKTDGFSIGNITYDKPFDARWTASSDISKIDAILDQPYRYLGKGHQTFVFESEDGNYVIKFLKCHLVEIKPWVAWLPLFGPLKQWRTRRIKAKQRRLEGIFSGWKIGFERLPAETGIVAVHMNTTDTLQKHLKVTNKAGWSYLIDLDQTAFVVQRKVEMLIPTLEGSVATMEYSKAETLLTSLLELYQQLCSAGISDPDPQIMRNTGVLEGRPILIDTGRLRLDPDVQERQACIDEIQGKTRLLLQWLHAHHPNLAQHFELQLAVLRNKND